MGISRLIPIILNNPSLFENSTLENCQLVIDGNCVENYLYEKTGLDRSYGGEYDVYSTKVENFFRVLQTFRVSPVIVFDGAYEMDDRKLKTIKIRGQKRIDEPTNYSPLLTHETFVFVLNKMAIKHVTCDFEADHEMVVLANRLKCPVLSFDSDFFIFDITGGFIPMDKIDFNLLSSGQSPSKIETKMYRTGNLYRRFPYLRGKLGLFASALGNDYVPKDSEALQAFYRALKLPKPDRHIFELHTDYFCAIIRKVLHWLENCRDESHGITELTRFMTPIQKNQLKLSIDTYANTTEYSGFDPLCDLQIPSDIEQTDSILPAWFVKGHRLGKIPNVAKNIILNRRNILLCQIENIDSTSSHNASLHLRQVIYGILLGTDICVQEFERDGNELIEKNVAGVVFPIGKHNKVPNLWDIPMMEKSEKLELLSTALSADVPTESMPACSIRKDLYLMILIFWLKKARLAADTCLIKSMLLSFVILSSSQNEDQNNLKMQIERVCDHRSSAVNVELRHSLAGFQSSLKYGKHLNSLLERPIEDIDPATIFSGSLIHKLYSTLQTTHEVDKVIQKLREFETLNLEKTYCDILDFVTNSL